MQPDASAPLIDRQEQTLDNVSACDDASGPSTLDAATSSRGTWVAEMDRSLGLARPLIVQGVLSYTSSLLALAFVGHMRDEAVLSGAVLANSLFNMSAWSVMSGLASGLETFCGQAYGSKNYKLMGLSLQRAILICFTVCIPTSFLWLNMEQVLLYLRQDPMIAHLAASYMQRLLPALWGLAVVECLRRYLTAQNVVWPAMFTTAITTILSPGYYYFFIYWLEWGIEGAAYAFDLTFVSSALLLVGYTVYRETQLHGTPMQSWTGWSRKSFTGWGQYLGLAAPATAMVCMEWWLWELLIFLSGYLPDRKVAVSVMGIAFQISAWVYMFPMGFGVATNTRVANELGAGRAERAHLASTVGVILSGAVAGCLSLSVLLFRRQIAELISTSEDIVKATVQVAPILALTFVGDGMNSALFAIMRASGRQVWGALMSMCSYWLGGLPLALFLGYHMQLGVMGLWMALASATTFQALICLIVLCRFDWRLEVKRAQTPTEHLQLLLLSSTASPDPPALPYQAQTPNEHLQLLLLSSTASPDPPALLYQARTPTRHLQLLLLSVSMLLILSTRQAVGSHHL